MGANGTKLTLRAYTRLGLLAIWTLLVVPPAFVVKFLIPPIWWVIPRFYHAGIVRILGIKIVIKGKPVQNKAVLFVSNHISWKDIPILGGTLKRASFISKSEVGGSFFARQMAGLQKTIYVRRNRRTEAKKQSEEMAERIKAGDGLILFPEGTTTRGVHVNKFKSTLFSVAEMMIKAGHQDVIIQPITLSFTHANNLAVLRAQRIKIGWVGTEDFWPHFKHALVRRSTRVTLEYHDPIVCDEHLNRKALAQHCEEVIREGLSRAHRDRG